MKRLIPLILAGLVLGHHYYKHGKWLEISDLDNHETLIVFLLGIWIGTLI